MPAAVVFYARLYDSATASKQQILRLRTATKAILRTE